MYMCNKQIVAAKSFKIWDMMYANVGRVVSNAIRCQKHEIAHLRKLTTTQICHEIFKVQSPEDFEQKVKKSDKLVVVDFFATWCNPCKMLTPRIESIVGEKAGAIKLAKVDIDEHSELALDYDVGAVPVLMVMKDGKVLHRMVGLQDTDKLRAWIDKAVADTK